MCDRNVYFINLFVDFAASSNMHDFYIVVKCGWHHHYICFSALGIQGIVL